MPKQSYKGKPFIPGLRKLVHTGNDTGANLDKIYAI